MKKQLLQNYKILFKHFGHRNWWPGDTAFEVCVGAILTQNTSWKNVEKALHNLKEAKILKLEKMLKTKPETLAELIRPSGYYNLKAKRLLALCEFLYLNGKKEISFENWDTKHFRKELLKVYGVGQETADSILLYAFNRTVFVIDTYTKRISSRLSLCKEDISYEDLQKLYTENLPADRELYNDYHAQFVALGSTYCKPKPLCQNCPLNKVCKFK